LSSEADAEGVEPSDTAATAFDALPAPAFVLDGDARLVRWNDRAAGVCPDPLAGRHVRVLLDGDGAAVEDALDRDEARVSITLRNGDPAALALRSLDGDGPGAATAVAWPGGTGRRVARLERALRVVTHDTRGPLAVAEGAVSLARETGDIDGLDRAQDAVERALAVLDEGVALARSACDERTEPVSVAAVAREAWAAVDGADATLSVASPGTVEADRDRLLRLVENLLRNCVEHGSAGPGDAATVRVDGLEDGGFFVADDGPGFPADRDRLFEAGWTGPDGGTGLGLAVVESVAAEHGWRVRAAESASGGARVEVRTGEPAG
jgi:signal transduction histidine kinase